MSRVTATDRVQRILAVLPWIIQNQGAPVQEICDRFGLSRKDLIADLEFVFYNVGLHPFTPDMLAEVSFDDDRVTVHVGDYFRRPLRLTHQEALNLLAAGRALTARTGTDPDGTLSRAVEKLAAALGPGAASGLDVALGDADPTVFATVRQGVTDCHPVEITYYSFGRDVPSTRKIEPYRLVAREGHWYLLAWCHMADGERLFRLDRVGSAELLDGSFDAPDPELDDAFDLSEPERTVELIAPAGAAWVAAEYPCDHFEELADGRVRIVLPITATPWLERLLVRLGPAVSATDVATGESLDTLRSAAAQRLLARYDTDSAGRPAPGRLAADG